MKILLIEDNVLVLAMLSETLRQHGHTVEVLCSLAASRLRLRGPAPDVVLLDWLLTDGVADHLLIEICAAWPSSKLIITTALTAVELPPTPSSAYLLFKPYTTMTLMAMIGR